MVADAFEQGQPDGPVAVLYSSGLDSAVLVAHAAAAAVEVQPIYVRAGLAWEREELDAAAVILRHAPFTAAVRPLVVLTVDMRDVYPATHWAIRGEAPAFDTPDEDVYIDGRNIVLLSKAAVYMARAGISRVMIGPLACNPFPDATPAFFTAMAQALSLGLAAPIVVEAPFAALYKSAVIRRGVELGVPLELTLSCMQPSARQHCGRCSKCRERIHAFRDAGVVDPTSYAAKTQE